MKKLLMDLGNRECRYPVEDDRTVIGHFYFCGEPAVADRPYCDSHVRRCSTNSTYLPKVKKA